MRNTEDLIAQLDDQMHSLGDMLEHALRELLGLDKDLGGIRLTKGGDSKKGSVGRTHREGKV